MRRRRCYRRALRLERAGSYETDAKERLRTLELHNKRTEPR